MSVRLDLYNDAKAVLIKLDSLKPDLLIHHIDIWNSQTRPENIEGHKQFRFPMVLFEFERANYREPKQVAFNTHIRGEQNYISNITLHIYTKALTDETQTFIEKEPLLEEIKYALKGLTGTNYGPLRLISDDYEKDHGNLFDSQLIFSSLVQESGVYDTQVNVYDKGVTEMDLELDGTLSNSEFLITEESKTVETEVKKPIQI